MENNIITIVVRESALDSIENDPDFAKHLVNAIRCNAKSGQPIDVHARSHIRAATIVEQHPNDEIKLLTIGYDYGNVLSDTSIGFEHHSQESKVAIIRDVVFRLGYFLKKRAARWDKTNAEQSIDATKTDGTN